MWSIFVVLRGKSVRPARRAARCAEPSFLLAGAVLSRVRRLGNIAEKRRKSMARRSDCASRTLRARKARFFRSWMRLGVDLGHLGELPGVPGRSFWRPGVSLDTLQALPRRAGDVPRNSRDAPGTPLGTSGRPGTVPRPILNRFLVPRSASGPTPSDQLRSTWASERPCATPFDRLRRLYRARPIHF